MKRNSLLFETPKVLENSNQFFKKKFISIISGLDKTAMNGTIEIRPTISTKATSKVKIVKLLHVSGLFWKEDMQVFLKFPFLYV